MLHIWESMGCDGEKNDQFLDEWPKRVVQFGASLGR
jgi:hypothetical protein